MTQRVDYCPIPNINGTDRPTLVAQQHTVMKAAEALLTALGEAFPHGRDWQTASEYDYRSARNQAADDLKYVRDIYNHAYANVLELTKGE